MKWALYNHGHWLCEASADRERVFLTWTTDAMKAHLFRTRASAEAFAALDARFEFFHDTQGALAVPISVGVGSGPTNGNGK